MRFTIIGSGAMGGVYGGRLALAGHEVSFVDVRPETVAAIRDEGLSLEGVGGTHRVRAPASLDAADFAPTEVAVILTDSNNTASAAEQAARVLGQDGIALTLQNGIGNVEALTAVLGAERVLAGVSYHSAAAPGPGRSNHTNDGPTYLGELDGAATARLQALADAIAVTGFRVACVDDVTSAIWTKFAVNCGYNALCAVTGLRAGEVSRTEAADTFQQHVLEELMAVVRAKGITLTFDDPVARVRALGRKAFNKPSMLQHMESGRPTEIDAVNGALVREARDLGIATPYNDALSLLVEARNKHMIQTVHGPEIDYEAWERELAGEAD